MTDRLAWWIKSIVEILKYIESEKLVEFNKDKNIPISTKEAPSSSIW